MEQRQQLRQIDVFPYYRRCTKELSSIYRYLQTLFHKEEDIDSLCKIRGYLPDSTQRRMLEELNIGVCEVDSEDLIESEMALELGMLSKTGRFLLNNRYIIPVYDIAKNLVTLIGYFNDIKKYITIPTPYFSKDVLFFNIDDAFRRSWEQYNGVVFLVEGIFDSLSLRSIGLPAIATMGSTVSDLKLETLKQFRKVVYIPDNDATGRKALNRFDRSGWRVPKNATGVSLTGEVDFNSVSEGEDGYSTDNIIKVKDVDNLVSWFDANDIRDAFLEIAESKLPLVEYRV